MTFSRAARADGIMIVLCGKLLGGISAIMGIGLFALPTGILVSGFTEQVRNRKETQQRVYPHCERMI